MHIDARDVLDPDGKTKRALRGRPLGYYQAQGPNSWDPYSFVAEPGAPFEVLPGIKIMMEPRGPRFRMRRHGRVFRVEWLPEDQDQGPLSSSTPSALREYFLQHYVAPFDEAAGHGAAAVIASKLDG